ncbi:hypothetical protein BT67DRAFT_153500 [Trichocladium antarcticum]|uniref:Amidoligase enzyme-domain-containing protein n=1 Tax=Trichocladium antarcticum TaxID=1450529 RepID=A0AAN6UF22_9PEZI|nr:hypothetical protein BT67DRAFT_153500 [Trichocladium antarcticum]
MAMAQQPADEFRFGIEIELHLASRTQKHTQWKFLATELSGRLAQAGIANHIKEAEDKSASKYRKWSIVKELTIPENTAEYRFGLELVSPIYTPATPTWAPDLDTIFTTLTTSFHLQPHDKCATHIHISRGGPTPLSAAELATVAHAALHHEGALDTLMPRHRRGQTGSNAYWARSNRLAPPLAGLSLRECLRHIDAAGGLFGGGLYPVVRAMNLFPRASVRGVVCGATEDFVHGKGYKWDFTGMLSARGTVEFRQPPGSVAAGDAAAWARLAVAFVAGALEVGSVGTEEGGVGEAGASVEALWELLGRGGRSLGWGDLGDVRGLLSRDGGGGGGC